MKVGTTNVCINHINHCNSYVGRLIDPQNILFKYPTFYILHFSLHIHSCILLHHTSEVPLINILYQYYCWERDATIVYHFTEI